MTSYQNAMPKLALVIEHGDVAQFHRLLLGGCDANTPLGRDGWPQICCAAASRQQEIVAMLLKHGADPNHAVESGMARGMVALDFCKDVPIARMLLKAGARPDVYDSHGRTPLDWATCMDRKDMVSLLAVESASNPT